MIGRFFAFLWSLARAFPATFVQGVRFGSGASVLLSFLTIVFGLIAIVLVILGFDLEAVDAWLDRNAGLFDTIGTILFKGLLAVILAICAFVVGAQIVAIVRGGKREDRPGGCLVLAALAIGYFCFVGVFNDI